MDYFCQSIAENTFKPSLLGVFAYTPLPLKKSLVNQKLHNHGIPGECFTTKAPQEASGLRASDLSQPCRAAMQG